MLSQLFKRSTAIFRNAFGYRPTRRFATRSSFSCKVCQSRVSQFWGSVQFAALDVATGQIKAGHYARRRREFLDFMNEIVAENPARQIHVILDNLNTHKPKRDRWLKLHPQVHLHYTPTYSSWLNQVECWFSILSRAALRGASFTSPRQLRDAIDAFVQSYNQNATPFEWTKAVVHSSGPKRIYSDLCK